MTIRLLGALVVTAAFTASACGGSSSTPAPAPAAPAAGKPVDPATAGVLAGTVTFVGTPPAPEVLKMSGAPDCAPGAGSTPLSDAVLVNKDGAVQNTFVFIQDGLDPAYAFALPTTSVKLDQKGCRYLPRVLGVRVGQQIEILNSDATSHNVHALPVVKGNEEFNKPFPIQGMRSTMVFTSPEVMVRFKCDIHAWMAAYIGVMAHPFFAVTNPDGTFEITGVPPGTYTIEAWHEKFGTRSARLTLDAKGKQTVSLRFGPE